MNAIARTLDGPGVEAKGLLSIAVHPRSGLEGAASPGVRPARAETLRPGASSHDWCACAQSPTVRDRVLPGCLFRGRHRATRPVRGPELHRGTGPSERDTAAGRLRDQLGTPGAADRPHRG